MEHLTITVSEFYLENLSLRKFFIRYKYLQNKIESSSSFGINNQFSDKVKNVF